MFTSKSYADFAMQKPFKARSTQPDMACANLLNILLGKTNAWRNLSKLMMRTYNFQCALHGKLNTWKKSSTFKGNYAVSAVNFICNLLTGPLIKMIFEGWRTMLKA